MGELLPPFSCTFSPNFAELLWELDCSLAFSTHHTDKLVFLSAKDREHMVQLPKTFKRPLGLCLHEGNLAVAGQEEVHVLANAPGLLSAYPDTPYDAFFAPRAIYYTGLLNLHDIAWTPNGLIGVNSLFSCLCKIDDKFSFQPLWKPPFISAIEPDSRCHLNGMAVGPDGRPIYATTFSTSDEPNGWRKTYTRYCGQLLDIASGEPVLKDLLLPHSPRILDGQLYVLVSGTGEVLEVDARSQKSRVINRLPGFVRGLAKRGNYLFVGLSKIRHKQEQLNDLPVAKGSKHAGIMVLDLRSGSVVAHLSYQNTVEEIYEVMIIPARRPGLLTNADEEQRFALVTPSASYWGNKS